jgi:hypothetical protein
MGAADKMHYVAAMMPAGDMVETACGMVGRRTTNISKPDEYYRGSNKIFEAKKCCPDGVTCKKCLKSLR